MMIYHPKPDEHGNSVWLKRPSKATPLRSWRQADAVATVVPGGAMPPELHGVLLEDWIDVPGSAREWDKVEGQCRIDEPPFHVPHGKQPAAGVAVREPDGRFWLVSPSNRFAGYATTLPKGPVSRQASAIREAYEEAGLKVKITGFLADSVRSQTFTRYYLAQRVGGNPASMGWESQAVHLVPLSALAKFLTHPNDVPLLKAIHSLPISST